MQAITIQQKMGNGLMENGLMSYSSQLLLHPNHYHQFLLKYRMLLTSHTPLPPLAAVGYVLIEQKCSLFGLEYKKDPTVILLYQIAKEALDHQIQDHNSTVERLIDVATETKKQFKRILEVSDGGDVGIKKMKSLASAGVLYAETCLHKYQWPVLDDSDMMPLPLDLPPNVQPPKRSTHIDILPQMPSEPQLDDMKYAREFKEEYSTRSI
ncbi:hypothetical protein BD770DRAFT_378087 [Pilaira anomala]|nr:hypothetical protein BD770DRAFT_378087 [Pilaira anomala]